MCHRLLAGASTVDRVKWVGRIGSLVVGVVVAFAIGAALLDGPPEPTQPETTAFLLAKCEHALAVLDEWSPDDGRATLIDLTASVAAECRWVEDLD